MQLRHIDPGPRLKAYIHKIWVFESSVGIPNEDMRMIVPSGRIKLVIPYHNVASNTNGLVHSYRSNSIMLVGVTDTPRIINDAKNNPSGTIGIEFNPEGAYRFFHLNQSELKNKIHSLTDVLGKIAGELEEKISEIASVTGKVDLIQQFLLQQFTKLDSDLIFEYCVNRIRLSRGNININALEKETGYSSRWLNVKFLEKIGLSPKNLSSVMRFNYFYHLLASGNSVFFTEKEFYNSYYDQSHFIKDFKRFTGLPPTKLAKASNDFGKIFMR